MKDLDSIFEYAFEKHEEAGHKYDRKEYAYHLSMAWDIAKEFEYLIEDGYQEQVFAAVICHDIIEDARESYNDVRNFTQSTLVAELVYSVTNEKGRNRKERANDKYYKGIKDTEYGFGIFIKLCDRIANLKHSKETKSRMFDLYKKENDNFKSKIFSEKYSHMFQLIDNLIS